MENDLRRAGKIDGNQNATVNLFREAGWSVHVTSSVGGGFPDLVVARGGFTALVELKLGRWASERNLSEDQQDFRKKWRGVYIHALSPSDALRQATAAAE